jgi:pimeloyl-ACP methyl ester carboxylesterase
VKDQGMPAFSSAFKTREIAVNGTTLHVRVGGTGPAVTLLHGYGETGDMWAPMANAFARDHTVVVPDLRGMGLSARATTGFDKKTQGQDMALLLDQLGVGKTQLVTHDIGNMVGYAFAAQNRDRVTRFVLIDAPVPGVGPWEEILKNPLLWHFRFGGPDMERLVAGRERIYLDRFWNEFSATPAASARPRAGITPACTRAPATCTRASRSSRPSTRTPSTTRPSWRRASSRCRCWPWAEKSRSARRWRW